MISDWCFTVTAHLCLAVCEILTLIDENEHDHVTYTIPFIVIYHAHVSTLYDYSAFHNLKMSGFICSKR